MSLAVYLQKQKAKGKPLSPADEKFLNACQPNKSKQDKCKLPPAAEKNEEANKKQEQWNEVNNIANHQFPAAIKGLKHDEWKPPPFCSWTSSVLSMTLTCEYPTWRCLQ